MLGHWIRSFRSVVGSAAAAAAAAPPRPERQIGHRDPGPRRRRLPLGPPLLRRRRALPHPTRRSARDRTQHDEKSVKMLV